VTGTCATTKLNQPPATSRRLESPSASQAGHRGRQRERDHVALGMVPDDRDPVEEHVGRDGADRDDDTERGEPSRGRHRRILPRTPVSFEGRPAVSFES